jgi:hypothetical protein
MANNEEERELLLRHRVGIVYLDNGNEQAFAVMKLLLNRWTWLEARIAEARPFAHLISLSGRSRPLDLHSPMPLGRVKSGRSTGLALRIGERSPANLPPETQAAVRLRLPGL